jgi:hypothetical protein
MSDLFQNVDLQPHPLAAHHTQAAALRQPNTDEAPDKTEENGKQKLQYEKANTYCKADQYKIHQQ